MNRHDAAGASPQHAPSDEYRLLDHLQRLGRGRGDYHAVHVHLARLRAQHRQDHHLRVAEATFASQVASLDGRLFALTNGDLFLVHRQGPPVAIDAAVAAVARLFSADPLTAGEGRAVVGRFHTLYDLADDFEEVLGAVKRLHRDRGRHRRVGDGGGRPPLTPARLGQLQEVLNRADVSTLVRSQAICTVTPGNLSAQPILHELYMSIAELQKSVLPDYDLAANPWLFQYLTQTLDQRMLTQLMRNNDGTLSRSLALNLNIDTVLSRDFLDFDAALPSARRRTLVVEFQTIDVFGDLGAFLFARDFLQANGHRVCLDGLDHHGLPMIDRAGLGLDLLKILWTPTMAESGRAAAIQAAVEAAGRARVILCRCDGPEAIAFGHDLGVTMFQGRAVDGLLSAQSGA